MINRELGIACSKILMLALVGSGCGAAADTDGSRLGAGEVLGSAAAALKSGDGAESVKTRHRAPRCNPGTGGGGVDSGGAGGGTVDGGAEATSDGGDASDVVEAGVLSLTPAQLTSNWSVTSGSVSLDANGAVASTVTYSGDGSPSFVVGTLALPTDWTAYSTLTAFFAVGSGIASVEGVTLAVWGGPSGVDNVATFEAAPSVNELSVDLPDPYVQPAATAVGLMLVPFIGATGPTELRIDRFELRP